MPLTTRPRFAHRQFTRGPIPFTILLMNEPDNESPKPLGQRHSKQREAILDVIVDAQGPLLVEEIHERAQELLVEETHETAKGGKPNLGIATVYRTVNLLLEKETIRGVTLPDGQKRYESSDLGHHHHFRCRTCDKVFDLHVCPVSLPTGTTLPEGFIVDGHELTLYGACPDCAGEDAAPTK